ncbi:DUF1003 domain-containing protein [Candidatus Enterococcus ferrettii]|uniref:DUF1003 domain-containing protein n=1 Tax=Candidatus Enterococcus ferrettii TaxID=2815324 RepID=A0ABV0EV62_9ENTE|nr:DUF1003 domain-containing protein [Enterococcus sp. 665A]MBO1340572.1 DUF1003 domain-containing protein [Enterococcus sp. 665A]
MTDQTKKTVQIKELESDLQAFIMQQTPEMNQESKLSYQNLLNYRFQYINKLLIQEIHITNQFDHELKHKIRNEQVHIQNVNDALKTKETRGQKLADGIAKFGGSWPFIIIFLLILAIWIVLNTLPLFFQPFDKFPFILLNLALSCLAAIQAPIILMSQNRQADRDRVEADNDYQVNVKAEVEIHLLHEKLDYLMSTKWQHILDLQKLQVEILQELMAQNKTDKHNKN